MIAASYLAEDTVGAIATASGGALSVIRVSGPGAFEALSRLTADPGPRKPGEERKLKRVLLRDPRTQAPLDDALTVWFPGPKSFTGEDSVELHLHGGAYLARRIMEVLATLGVRQALPGEFSFRAVRNGKMTLSQATALADLISSSNDAAIAIALEKLSGSQNRLLSELSSGLRKLASFAEVAIDFSDQDIEELSLPALKLRLGPVLLALNQLKASFSRGEKIQDGLRIAFVGLANSGKSSFFNALLGEERSIVSETPGTTRDVIHEKLTLRGSRGTVTVRIEDTAGLRSTECSIERSGVERSQRAALDADLILFTLDASRPPQAAMEAWHALGSPSLKALGLITKCDLLDIRERNPFLMRAQETFRISRWVETSAKSGEGIDRAIEAILELTSPLVKRGEGEVVLTRLNQYDAVSCAVMNLDRAALAPETDLFASDVRQALNALAPMIGETLPDDILGHIFSEFCIGK